MALNWYLNGINLKDYGITVSGSDGIVDGLQMKPPFKVDLPDCHGEIVDLDKLRYEPRDITLNCWIKASGMLEFTGKVNTFNQILRKSGTHRFMIEIDPRKPLVYEVYFPDKTAIDKKWSNSTMIGTFSLRMREPFPIKKVLKFTPSNLGGENLVISTNIIYDQYPNHKTGELVSEVGYSMTELIEIIGNNLSKNEPAYWQQGNYNNGTGEYNPGIKNYICQKSSIKVIPNTEYNLRVNKNFKFWILLYDVNDNFIRTIDNPNGIFKTDSKTFGMRFNGRKNDGSDSITPSNSLDVNTVVDLYNSTRSIAISNKDNKDFSNVRVVFYDANNSFVQGLVWSGIEFGSERVIKCPLSAVYICFSANLYNNLLPIEWKVENGDHVTSWNQSRFDEKSSLLVEITLSSSSIINISWGDGYFDYDIVGDNINISHTYKAIGSFNIILSGVIEEIKSITTNASIIWNIL